VVLYEMLTGQRPYTLARHSLAALEEAILCADVPAPSSAAGVERRLARQLRGDLDTIVGKALNKPVGERYASVEAMAADVQRHLEGQPVLARRASRGYRLGKRLRRHWRAAAAALAVLLALGSGLAVATVQGLEAARQRAEALRQLKHAQAALDFVQAVLTEGVSNDEALTRAELLQRSRRFVERGPTAVERALSADQLAAIYLSYGNYRDAESVLAHALAGLPASTDAALARRLQCKQAHAWSQLGRKAGAVQQLEAVVAQAGEDPDVASYCLRLLAIIARNDNHGEAALAYATEALRRLDEVHTERPLSRAMVRAELAYAHALRGRPDLADIEYAAAMAAHESQGRGEAITAVSLLNNWGIALLNSGRPLMALDRFEQAAAISRRRSPDGQLPPYLIGNLANTLRALGRFETAREAFVHTRTAALRAGGQPATEIQALVGQVLCLLQLQRPDAAEPLLREAQALASGLAEALSPLAPPAVGLKLARAQLHKARGQGAEAKAVLDALVAEIQAAGLRNVVPMLAHLNRADLLQQLSGADAAMPDAEAALAIAQGMQQGLPYSSLVGQAWLTLGRLHQAAGREGPAREAYALALQHLVATVGPEHHQAVQAQQGVRALR
jgi:serine/threonine-protein kinase